MIALAFALVAAAAEPRAIRFDEYLAEVSRANADLAAQRAGVSVAEAQIAVAKLFPEPQLSVNLSPISLSTQASPLTTSLGLSEVIELGGKRGARISAAELDHQATKAGLDDFLRTLRGTAANAFIDSLAARLGLQRKQQTLADLQRLVKVNEERLRVGDIGQVAVVQSRVEADRFRADVLSAQADVRNADLALAQLLGGAAAVQISPEGELQMAQRQFDLDSLLARAKERPDIASKQRAVDASKARIGLARANRWLDVTASVGYEHTATGSGPFQDPAFDGLGVGISIPLPFRLVYRGELDGAIATQVQAEAQWQSAVLKADVEVRQALSRYEAGVQRVALYTGGVLADADKVLDAVRYSYEHGSATLLELLDAQRTANEVHLAYFDALADHARAIVAVEQAAGFWDLHF